MTEVYLHKEHHIKLSRSASARLYLLEDDTLTSWKVITKSNRTINKLKYSMVFKTLKTSEWLH